MDLNEGPIDRVSLSSIVQTEYDWLKAHFACHCLMFDNVMPLDNLTPINNFQVSFELSGKLSLNHHISEQCNKCYFENLIAIYSELVHQCSSSKYIHH